MNMNSQYLWEKGGSVDMNPVSVILQQVSSRKKESLLACVCESSGQGMDAATESGYLTERLVEWFHQKYLRDLMEQGRESEITKALGEEVTRSIQELTRYAKKKEKVSVHYSGILIRNAQCWIFQGGEPNMFLFNRRYNKEHMRPIVLSDDMPVWEGRIQKNIGLLLCSKGVREHFDEDEILEVLFGDKRCEEEHIKKRLMELWREGEIRGLKSAGAVCVRIK